METQTMQLLGLMAAVMILQAIVIAFQRWRIRELGLELSDYMTRFSVCAETCRKLRHRSKILAVISLVLCSSTAMSQNLTEPAYRIDKDPTVGSIVTNGQLENRDFTLLLIHNGDQFSSQILGMVTRPQSAQLKRWTDALQVRPMHVNEPFVGQHHSDLLQKHQNQFPIVAVVDNAGGVWWSAAGNQIPTTELTLCKQISEAYAATLRAARESAPAPIPAAKQQSLDWQFNGPADTPQSRFLDRGVSAPDPIALPSVVSPGPVPIGHAAAGGDETLILIGALCVVCSLILAGGVVAGSAIMANAMTDDDAEAASIA